MRIAILMANTDESDFAQRHPDDGAKFTALLHRVRPDWSFEVFRIIAGEFPPDLDFDGLLITGSPASVHDTADWITRLEETLRVAVAQNLPLFGACFGHQIIAKALGAQVGYNPQGWVLGRVETMTQPEGRTLPVYAAHKEQVLSLPEGAHIVARTTGCDIAGFAIRQHVLTTQYHPEMTQDFIAALLLAFEDQIGADVTRRAADTLEQGTDMDALASWIAQFYEIAQIAPRI